MNVIAASLCKRASSVVLWVILIIPWTAWSADLVPAGSLWSYWDNGTDLGTAWRAPAYDDSDWSLGRAQLGYGDNDEVTVVNGGPDGARYITTYFRKSFFIDEPSMVSQLVVNLLRDDGAVVYLNGVELFRDNMPAGTITASTPALSAIPNSDESVFFFHSVNPARLVPGQNVLAVEIHQSGPGSSDISFDLRLTAVFSGPPVIVSQPASRTVVTGGSVTFSAQAEGLAPLRYQWDFNGTPIPNATAATYRVENASLADEGDYRVVVTNQLGEAVSEKAHLTVVELLGETFKIVELTADNAVAIEHGQLTGDDRGGIATSLERVFVTGDSQTARFGIEDLSGATGIGQLYDSLVGDLRSGKVYVLANGTSPIFFGGGLVDGLLEVDGSTGALTANRIALSQTLNLAGDSVGIFSGFGRIVLHSSLGVYDISLPSGAVANLGTMTIPVHQFAESWAYWGVAEFFDGSLWLDYVRDPQTIVRTRVPDGTTQPVATFQNLSDMASFTVSPFLGRWYFHHEGQSQFRSGDETVGFADASFSFVQDPSPPQIVVQPQGRKAGAGTDVELRVFASGYPLFYQWLFNNTVLVNETNATLQLDDITQTDAGNYSVVVSNALGVVTSSNANLVVVDFAGDTFKILELTADNAVAIEHGQFTGDDRGGIAASLESVFVTGDSQTARFGIEDLSGATGIGQLYDSLVGDLRSGAVYVLANGTSPIFFGGLVDGLLEVDGSTGALTANRIAFSESIQLGGGAVGIFSGFGRIVLRSDSGVYNISLPSGEVLNLGTMTIPVHQFAESWAYWGVAEFFDGSLWVDYVRDPQTIVRTRVPDGTTQPVATFQNLSDMASFTVSPFLGRWYFHHEGQSQFRSGDETVGFADASFSFVQEPSPPQIRSQPRNRTAGVGTTTEFRVFASGYPLFYQWLFNDTVLVNETNSTLQLDDLSETDAGNYSVVVSNALGVVTSSNAMLVVVQGATVGVFNNPNYVDTSDIPGQPYASSANVQASLRLFGHTPARFTNILSALNSDVLMFPEIVFAPLAENLTAAERQGLRSYVEQGGLIVVLGGFSNVELINSLFEHSLEFAFQGNPSFDLTPQAVASPFANGPREVSYNSDVYTVFTSSLPDLARNIYGAQVESAVTLIPYGAGKIIYLGWNWFDAAPNGFQDGGWLETLANAIEARAPLPPTPPILYLQPISQTTLEGLDVVLTVGAVGSAPLRMQWYYNGSPVTDATNASLRLPSVASAQSGEYFAVLTNTFGMATSEVATLNVIPSRGVVGYYTDFNEFSTGPEDSILAAGFTPIQILDISTFDFNRLSVLVLNEASYFEIQGNLIARVDDLATWVNNGGKLIIHDQYVDGGSLNAHPLLVGAEATILHKSEGSDIDIVLPADTLVTAGPHGSLNNFSLDEGFYSDHGYAELATLPPGARPILIQGGGPDRVVAFSYGLGAGLIYYATIPLDYHLDSDSSLSETFRNVYLPNVIEHAVGYTVSGPPILLSRMKRIGALDGGTLKLSANVTGESPFEYQWLFEGSPIAGATDSTLQMSGITLSGSGVYSVVVSNPVGAVTGAVAIVTVVSPRGFKIRDLLATNCQTVDHGNLSGDDRGGIALSSSQVFYSGDESTVRYSASTLGAGARVGRVYDALASNLRTETAYSLANGTNLLEGPGTVTRLIQLDSATGLLLTNRIDLSEPIALGWDTGIFSGYDAIMLHSGARVYRIELPSGLVLNLGDMQGYQHNNCENWAYWGVAEYFNGAPYLVYVRDSQTIVRTRVPDGETTVVANFEFLSDMCSFTFSPSRDRWYYHYEGNGQFGGFNETLGYCGASWDRPPALSPIANRTINEDTSDVIPFVALDTETPFSELTVTAESSNPSLGLTFEFTSSSNQNRVLTVTPAPNAYGTSVVTVKLFDETGNPVARSFTLTVNPVNDAPAAISQTVELLEDDAAVITLIGADVDNDPLSYSIGTPPSHGTLLGDGPNWIYTPNPDYYGQDNFTFTVSDGTLVSSDVAVLLEVLPVNDPPVARPGSIDTLEDTPVTVALIGEDIDGITLSYIVTTPPSHGLLTGTGPNLTYTPNPDYAGSDGFEFKVNDGEDDSAPASVGITVVPVNDHPLFVRGPDQTVSEDSGPQSVAGWAGSIRSGPANEANQTVVFLVSQTNPSLFSTPPAVSPDGTLTYTPAPNSNGTATVTVIARDDGGTANGGQPSSPPQSFTITVQPVNDAPTAISQSVEVDENSVVTITMAGTDVEGDALQFDVVTPPTHGTLTGTGTDRQYRPNAGYSGPDSFTYKASDGQLDSEPATVSVLVREVNDPPTAMAKVEPLFYLIPGSGSGVLLSSNNIDALAVFDASLSHDPDNDPLVYWWYADGSTVPFATGLVATNRLEIGEHLITLIVDDGLETGIDTLTIQVAPVSAAVEEFMVLLNNTTLDRNRKRPLLASLKEATASLDRESFISGANQLVALQNKIRAQVSRQDPVLGQELIDAIQRIIDVIRAPVPTPELKK